jgi:hypothetical protein
VAPLSVMLAVVDGQGRDLSIPPFANNAKDGPPVDLVAGEGV